MRPAQLPPVEVDIETTADFLNTLALSGGTPTERLATADEAIAFLGSRTAAPEPALRAQAAREGEGAWLERVRRARAALRALWDAQAEHRPPDPADIALVNDVLREAPRLELAIGEGCCEIGYRRAVDDPTGEALARLAQPFLDSVASGTTGRLRICANDDCRWAFSDMSRAGRRRWCDMATCGNVAKARRHRARTKAASAGANAARGGEAATDRATAAGD